MNPGRGAKRPRSIRLNAMQQGGKGRILLRAVLPTCPGRPTAGAFSVPDMTRTQMIANSTGFFGHVAFFGQPAKCEIAHTSFRLAPLKSGMTTSIWRQEGTHGTKTRTS